MLPELRTYLLEHWPDMAGPRPRDLAFLVQATGVGKVCCFVFPDEASLPSCVAKMRRTPLENDLLSHEYGLIQRLRQDGTDYVRATIPGPLLTASLAGQFVGIEAYLTARPMDGLLAATARHTDDQLREYLDAAIGWLVRSQMETGAACGRLSERQIHAYFLEPVQYLRLVARLTAAEDAYLELILRRLRTLAHQPLALVFQHGDFQPGNVLVQDGTVQVIDWEFGSATALPLVDVFSFLMRTFARCRHLEEMDGDIEDYIDNLEEVFFEGGSFSHFTLEFVSRAVQALKIDPMWLGVLFPLFLVTEANKYHSLLRRRADTGYLYLLHSNRPGSAGSYDYQLARQKNVWLLGHMAEHEDRLIFRHLAALLGCR